MNDGLNDIREVFAARLAELGVSATSVSRRATGQPDTLRKFLKEGVTPGASKIRSVCRELGLEFYVGPPRASGASEEPKIVVGRDALFSAVNEAVTTALAGLSNQRGMQKQDIELDVLRKIEEVVSDIAEDTDLEYVEDSEILRIVRERITQKHK